MREGDVLHAQLPQSGAADMVIDSINTVKKTLRLKRRTTPLSVCGTAAAGATNEAANSSPAYAAPAADLILLQWVLKGSKTDTIIRQATEAGVRAVLPVIGEFSVAKTKPCTAGTVQAHYQRSAAAIGLSDRYHRYGTGSACRSAQYPKNTCTGCYYRVCSVQRSRRRVRRISPTACRKTFPYCARNRSRGRHKPRGSSSTSQRGIPNHSF